MGVNTLLKVLEQLLHKIKANRRREMVASLRAHPAGGGPMPVTFVAKANPGCNIGPKISKIGLAWSSGALRRNQPPCNNSVTPILHPSCALAKTGIPIPSKHVVTCARLTIILTLNSLSRIKLRLGQVEELVCSRMKYSRLYVILLHLVLSAKSVYNF